MRIAALTLLLAGCVDIGMPGVGVTQPGIVEPGPLCLTTDPSSVVFDGTIAPEERLPVAVMLYVPGDCFDPFTVLEGAELDDPSGAFAVAGLEEPVELGPDESIDIEVSLLAAEAGTYEGQLVVRGVNGFGEGSATVQLFAEIQ